MKRVLRVFLGSILIIIMLPISIFFELLRLIAKATHITSEWILTYVVDADDSAIKWWFKFIKRYKELL